MASNSPPPSCPMLADYLRVAPYRGRPPNGVSRLVARLTRRASDSPWMRSVTADTQVLGARRVVHEMRASVFVARTVLGAPPSRLQSCDCCGTSSCSWDGSGRSQQGGRKHFTDHAPRGTRRHRSGRDGERRRGAHRLLQITSSNQ